MKGVMRGGPYDGHVQDVVILSGVAETFTLLGIDVVAHVLSNGQRIVENDSLQRYLAAIESEPDRPAAIERDKDERLRFESWVGKS